MRALRSLRRLGIRAGAVVLSAEAVAYFDRMTVEPDAARKTQINTFISSLKSNGVWDKLDALWVLAMHTEQAALLNAKGDIYNLTKNGTPTFTADTGFNGDGTLGNYLIASDYDADAAVLGYSQNSACMGAFAITAGASAGYDMGQSSVNDRVRCSSSARCTITSGLAAIVAPAGSAPHHIVGSRLNATHVTCYRNGVGGALTAVNSQALSTNPITMLAQTTGSTATDRTIGVVHVGQGLTDAEVLALYNASAAYLQSVGAV